MVAADRRSCSAWRSCLSVLNVYFRDTQHLVGIGLQLWFYATPIVYPITLVAAMQEVIGVEFRSSACTG